MNSAAAQTFAVAWKTPEVSPVCRISTEILLMSSSYCETSSP